MTHDFYRFLVDEIAEKANLYDWEVKDKCSVNKCAAGIHRFCISSSFRCIEVQVTFYNAKVRLFDGCKSGGGSKTLELADPECEDKTIRFIQMAETYGG